LFAKTHPETVTLPVAAFTYTADDSAPLGALLMNLVFVIVEDVQSLMDSGALEPYEFVMIDESRVKEVRSETVTALLLFTNVELVMERLSTEEKVVIAVVQLVNVRELMLTLEPTNEVRITCSVYGHHKNTQST
jgi:hypothetical protein